METQGIRIERLNSGNFGPRSLDGFVRTQPVTEVWRRSPEGYRLVRQPFVDDWSPERKREKARQLLAPGCTVYGAFIEGRVVGFVQLNDALNGGCMIVESLHVSREFRHRGLGRALFERALGEAGARSELPVHLRLQLKGNHRLLPCDGLRSGRSGHSGAG